VCWSRYGLLGRQLRAASNTSLARVRGEGPGRGERVSQCSSVSPLPGRRRPWAVLFFLCQAFFLFVPPEEKKERGLAPARRVEVNESLDIERLSTLGRPPSLVARERRYQPVPSPRNRERSGEQRNAATLQWRGWAGRLRVSHEWSGQVHAVRGESSGIPHHRTPPPEVGNRANSSTIVL